MAIKIIRKPRPTPPAAPVVPEALPAGPVEPAEKLIERTKEEMLESWRNFPGPNAKAKECPYCHHLYIMPCDEMKYAKCSNWQVIQTRLARKRNEEKQKAKA